MDVFDSLSSTEALIQTKKNKIQTKISLSRSQSPADLYTLSMPYSLNLRLLLMPSPFKDVTNKVKDGKYKL